MAHIFPFLVRYEDDNPNLDTAELFRSREEATCFYIMHLDVCLNTGWLWFFLSGKVGKGTFDVSMCYRLPSLHCNNNFNHLDSIITLMNVKLFSNQKVQLHILGLS